MEARWRRGERWWHIPPIIGKPTHRPIWHRPMTGPTNADLIVLMQRLYDQCGKNV